MVRFLLRVAVAAALAMSASPAAADCVEEDDNGTPIVVCTGVTLDGYTITNPDVRDLLIEAGGEVFAGVDGNGAAIDSAIIDPDKPIIINEGTIFVTQDNQVGIRSLGSEVNNGSRDSQSGDITPGRIEIGSQLNRLEGTIGIEVGDEVSVFNNSEIIIFGSNAPSSSENVAISAGVGIAGDTTLGNRGTIEVDGYNGVGFRSDSDIRIVNLGDVIVEGDNGRAIEVLGSGNEITNDGLLRGGLVGVQFLENNLANSNSLTNLSNGTIEAISGDAVISGDTALLLENEGTIKGDVLFGAGDDELIFDGRGSISGRIDGGAGTDHVDFRASTPSGAFDFDELHDFESARVFSVGGFTGTFSFSGEGRFPGGISIEDVTIDEDLVIVEGDVTLHTSSDVQKDIIGGGSNALVLVGDGRTGLDLDAVESFNELRIALDDPAAAWILRGTSEVFAGGTTAESGTVELSGDVHIKGGMLFESGTSLALTIDGPDPSNTLRVTNGPLTIEQSVGLDVHFSSGPSVRDIYTIITAPDGITASASVFDPVTATPSSSLFQIDSFLAANNTQVQVKVERLFSYEDVAVANGSSAASIATAAELDDLEWLLHTDPQQLGPAIEETLNVLLTTPVPGPMTNAFDQLSPEAYDAHSSAAINWAQMQTRAFATRPVRCDRFHYPPNPKIISQSPCGEKRWTAWLEGLGFVGERDAGNTISYDQSGGGALVGFDYRLDDGFWFSAGVGAGSLQIDVDNRGDGHLHTADLGIALAQVRDKLTLRSVLTYSHAWHTLDRDVDFVNQSTEGEFQSNRATVLLGASYRERVGSVQVEPVGSLEFTYLNENGFYEDGDPGVSLKLSDREAFVFSTTAGAIFSTNMIKYQYVGDLLEWADGVWTPEIKVAWRANWTDSDRKIRARFSDTNPGSGTFRVDADDDTHGAEIGAHLRFQPLRTGASVSLDYDGYFSEDNILNRFGMSFRVPF